MSHKISLHMVFFTRKILQNDTGVWKLSIDHISAIKRLILALACSINQGELYGDVFKPSSIERK